MTPGARVQVRWTDGRVYPATVLGAAQGLVHVRWDSGGQPAWVPGHAILDTNAIMAAYGGASQQAQPSAAPPPPQWQVQAVERTPAPVAAAAPPGPPPRPTSATIRELPRGLVYEPTAQGPGTGRAFFVFFGFISTADSDVAMRMTDIEHLGDDVAALRAAGYRVVVDLHGDLLTLDAALTNRHPEAQGLITAGVFWGGHGDDDGAIGDAHGGDIFPEQISKEVAALGTVRLFAMSACYAGNHVPRWQKALGPQAVIIGWGAPITNERAIEFLTPDEQSSKGFDDLILRHLGARRVCGDAPLVEVRELARKHEDQIALVNLSFDELVEGAAKKLGVPLDRSKSGDAYFIVKTPSSKDRPNVPRSQRVRVSPVAAGATWINIGSLVGPYTEALDLARALRVVAPSLHVRVALAKVTPPDAEFVMVETLFRRRRLDVMTLVNNIRMIGSYADRIEDMYFGSDQR